MKAKLTGEYCIPGVTSSRIVDDHIERYKFAAKFIKGKRVLDIACGTGYGSQMLAKKGAKEIHAVDNNKEVIAYAKKNFKNKRVKFIISNILKYSSKKPYDTIVCLETIEHIKEDKKALLNLYKLLAKKGNLIISSPNRLITSPEALSISSKPLNHFHVREYTVKELESLLKSVGFNVRKVDIYGQRLRIYFKYSYLRKIYDLILNPDYRSNSSLKHLSFLIPRYFTIRAHKI